MKDSASKDKLDLSDNFSDNFIDNIDELDTIIELIEQPDKLLDVVLPDIDSFNDVAAPNCCQNGANNAPLTFDDIDFSILGENHLSTIPGISELIDSDFSALSRLSIGAYKGKLYYLDRFGLRLEPQEDTDLMPYPVSVALARVWINYVLSKDIISTRDKINRRYNSYQLKGAAERFGAKLLEENENAGDGMKINSYIGNGDLIAAMLSFPEIKMRPDSSGRKNNPRNAFFFLNFPLSLEDRVRAYLTEPLLLGPAQEPYLGFPEQKTRYEERHGA